MAKGVPHFFKDGKAHGPDGMGAYHKMPDGTLHSGKTHTKSSKRLYHLNELSKTVQDKIKKKKKDVKGSQSRNRKKTKR